MVMGTMANPLLSKGFVVCFAGTVGGMISLPDFHRGHSPGVPGEISGTAPASQILVRAYD